MPNLLEETIQEINNSNHSISDIDWIGGSKCYIDVQDFINMAAQTYYDAGYGSQEVAEDLVIVFKDNTWLERAGYDGSEWWRYQAVPQKPLKKITPKRLSNYWAGSLSAIQILDDDGYPIGE